MIEPDLNPTPTTPRAEHALDATGSNADADRRIADLEARLAEEVAAHEETKETCSRLIKDAQDLAAGNVTIRDLAIRNGTISADIATETAGLIAERFGALLRKNDAQNYLEMQFRSRETDDRICLTLRWEDGKTPHECRRLAELERDSATRQAASLRSRLLGAHDYLMQMPADAITAEALLPLLGWSPDGLRELESSS